jgi:hypothetical protein
MSHCDEIMDPERGRSAGEAALAARRARHETMVYIKDGWVLIEHGDGRVERVCPESDYRAEAVTARLDPRKAEHAPAAE